MDLTPEKLVGGGTALTAAGFLARWAWDRWWHKKDAQIQAENSREVAMAADIAKQADRIVVVERKLGEAEAREESRIKMLGRLESEQHRLDGKLEGLQSFWRGEFEKMTAQFTAFEEKVDYRLDAFRLELRGDQQQSEERLTELLTAHQQRESAERSAHQQRVHDRLNAISVEQAKMLNELIDSLVDRAGEPRMTPPKVT